MMSTSNRHSIPARSRRDSSVQRWKHDARASLLLRPPSYPHQTQSLCMCGYLYQDQSIPMRNWGVLQQQWKTNDISYIWKFGSLCVDFGKSPPEGGNLGNLMSVGRWGLSQLICEEVMSFQYLAIFVEEIHQVWPEKHAGNCLKDMVIWGLYFVEAKV